MLISQHSNNKIRVNCINHTFPYWKGVHKVGVI
jgi:hypothetical protein